MKNYDQSVKINHNHKKNQRPDIDKIYLYVKYPSKSKYQLLINGKKIKIKKELKNYKI